jgi:hypothetical protein
MSLISFYTHLGIIDEFPHNRQKHLYEIAPRVDGGSRWG